MENDNSRGQRSSIEDRIAKSMEEVRQLNSLPTLNDFEDYWKKKLERGLAELWAELEALRTTTQAGQAAN